MEIISSQPTSAGENRMNEILSAFYWRETLLPKGAAVTRRKPHDVTALSIQAKKLRDEGMDTQEIAFRIGVTRRYVQRLLKHDNTI
jgi:hypothetical protein